MTSDGTVYVGLAEHQSVAILDPKSGAIRKEVVLDHPEIASTKDLVTLRIDADETHLVVANGSDESVTVLSLPDLHVLREITLEGEMVRDAIPDPKGRYLYVLGRTVHVFDAAGEREIRNIEAVDPMAIATTSDGSVLAVVGGQQFSNGPATVVSMWDAATMKEIDREPLQTDRTIRAALFADGDRSLVVFADDWMGERPFTMKRGPELERDTRGTPTMTFRFGDLVSGERLCLPEEAGAQIAVLGPDPRTVLFGEKRCGVQGGFTASPRRVRLRSIYGVAAHAIGYDSARRIVYVSIPAGQVLAWSDGQP